MSDITLLTEVLLSDEDEEDGTTRRRCYKLKVLGGNHELDALKDFIADKYPEFGCHCDHDCCGHWFSYGGRIDQLHRSKETTSLTVVYNDYMNV